MVDETRFEKIDPAQIELTHPYPNEDQQVTAAKNRGNLWIFFAASSLILLVISVIFILPQWVTRPAPTVSTETAIVTSSTPLPESPFQQAQLAQARRQAQNILSAILAKQTELENKQVLLWAKETFEQAQKTAEQGDRFYRQRNFNQAMTEYQQALEILTNLSQQAGTVVKTSLISGYEAIMAGNQLKAFDAFERVLAIDSENAQGNKGRERARLIPQTKPLMGKAQNLYRAGEIQGARGVLTELLSLDAEHAQANKLLIKINTQVTEQSFNAAMSKGLIAMQNSHYSSALNAFQHALTLKPRNSDALSSLEQASDQLLIQTIRNNLRKAKSLENSEQWDKALSLYQKIMETDDTIIDARIGLIRTKTRHNLDTRVENILANPLRLASGSVYVEASQLLQDAEAIKQIGPRINHQISELQVALKQARTPVIITLQSDNKTQVTLLRVGEIGTFTSKQIKLRPGLYIALGSRSGFQDVRVQFQVIDTNSQPVVVICRDPV